MPPTQNSPTQPISSSPQSAPPVPPAVVADINRPLAAPQSASTPIAPSFAAPRFDAATAAPATPGPLPSPAMGSFEAPAQAVAGDPLVAPNSIPTPVQAAPVQPQDAMASFSTASAEPVAPNPAPTLTMHDIAAIQPPAPAVGASLGNTAVETSIATPSMQNPAPATSPTSPAPVAKPSFMSRLKALFSKK